MIFLYILFGFIFLIFFCLCVPVTVTAGYEKSFYVKVRYLFFTLLYPDTKKKKNTAVKEKKSKKSKSKQKSLAYFDDLFQHNSLPDAISELCAVLRLLVEKFAEILRGSSMRRFSLQIIAYNADAAAAAIQYGSICATVYPFLGFINSLISFKQQNVEIICDYTGGKNSFQLDLKWQVIPLFCLGPLITFIFDLIKNKGR